MWERPLAWRPRQRQPPGLSWPPQRCQSKTIDNHHDNYHDLGDDIDFYNAELAATTLPKYDYGPGHHELTMIFIS